MAAVRWTSDERMIETYKRDYDLEAGMIRMIDEKDAAKYQTVTGEECRWRAEAVAVHDLLYEFAGKRGVNFGHGVVAPAWCIERDAFLNHGRTVAQDENGDRVHVAFPRVADEGRGRDRLGGCHQHRALRFGARCAQAQRPCAGQGAGGLPGSGAQAAT